MFPPIIRVLFNLIRSSESLERLGKIDVIGVDIPVYEIPNNRYVIIAHQNLAFVVNCGDQNIRTNRMAKGKAIHKK